MINLLEIAGQRPEMRIEKADIRGTFIDLASGFASLPGTVLLMSGGELDCSGYHILGVKPWLSFTGRGHHMKIWSKANAIDLDADPFTVLRTILDTYKAASSSPLPFTSGLMGYLTYDLKDHIENLPRTSVDDLCLPQICLFAPSVIFIHDKKDGSTWLCSSPDSLSDDESTPPWSECMRLMQESHPPDKTPIIQGRQNFTPNMTKDEYMASLEKIRGYIASGDVYQVNFAHRFESEYRGDPFALFKEFYRENPAPFFAYLNAGNHQIVSSSPERFILRDGRQVETRPIKGTRPRGKDITEDQRLRNELKNSKKDEAELSMIVDLLRNDLGRVCEAGSVHVAEHKRVEEYKNVFHMVSIVRGRLDPSCDSIDLLRATFPGGSITGCPKIRAMEIIDELEPNRRHVYTGSIGYLSFHDTMDLSVAIRTAAIYNRNIYFSLGGGIVYDSNPFEEYEETLLKGKTIMNAIEDGKVNGDKEMAWINGIIRPVYQAHLKVSDLGFQYGYGFFETIRYSRGMPGFLDDHMTRFKKTWKELFKDEFPDLSWRHIIDQVIDANRLNETVALIKIIASWGSRTEPPYDHSLVVTARPYTHRMSGKNSGGLRLATYPFPRQTPLADYKTLNYAYYYLAGKWAGEHGADEALIMNPDYTVSETNTACIFIIKGEKALRPLSLHCLPGIMEERISGLLASMGYDIEKRVIAREDLFAADNIFIANSLMGAVPITELDKKSIKNSTDICNMINDMLL